MTSRIEQIVSELEEYVDNCKPYPFSGSKIIANKDELEEYLGELRRKLPQEITKYKNLIEKKDAILSDAREQAASILDKAQIQTDELVNEHEIMQRAYAEAEDIKEQAYAQAQAILDQATEEANQMRYGAVQYTDDMLANLQRIIEHSIESNRSKYEGLLNALDKDLNVVISNRNELAGIGTEEEQPQQDDAAAGLQDSDDYEE